MAADLPQIELQRVRQWCQQRTPAHVRHQLRLAHTTRGREITVVERRVPWDAPDTEFGPHGTSRPIARLRHSAKGWRLYWPDHNTRWHLGADVPAAHSSDDTQPLGRQAPRQLPLKIQRQIQLKVTTLRLGAGCWTMGEPSPLSLSQDDPVPLIPLATNGYENGPCPTFYQAKGGVVVGVVLRGYETSDREHTPPGMPEHEGVLFIPDADWDHLLSELSLRR